MFRIDDHVGIAIAGLTSDARVLRCVLESYTLFIYRSLTIDIGIPQQLHAAASNVIKDGFQQTDTR